MAGTWGRDLITGRRMRNLKHPIDPVHSGSVNWHAERLAVAKFITQHLAYDGPVAPSEIIATWLLLADSRTPVLRQLMRRLGYDPVARPWVANVRLLSSLNSQSDAGRQDVLDPQKVIWGVDYPDGSPQQARLRIMSDGNPSICLGYLDQLRVSAGKQELWGEAHLLVPPDPVPYFAPMVVYSSDVNANRYMAWITAFFDPERNIPPQPLFIKERAENE